MSAESSQRKGAFAPSPSTGEGRGGGECREGVAALLLAAGASSRMGERKLLLPVGGVPMIRASALALLQAGFSPLFAVTGPRDESIQEALAGLPVVFVRNPNPGAGMASSLAAGVKALPDECDAVAVALGDMPFVRPRTLTDLLDAFRASPKGLLAPRHRGSRGHPVFFDLSRYRGELLKQTGDRGARALVEAHADDLLEREVDDPGVLADLDTPQAYRRAVAPLACALGVEAGGLVALAGAGGKTTLMLRLAREWAALGRKAAAATTTKIFPPEPESGFCLCLGGDTATLARVAGECHGIPVFGASLLPEGKVRGIEPAVCDALMEEGVLDALAVEADGSRRMPLKGYGPDEPVVPQKTAVFVAVAGLSCLGAPLDEAHVFRPERVAPLAGLSPGEPVDEAALARFLSAPGGLASGAPHGAARVLVLNQADTPALAEAGRRLAASALASGLWERAVVARLAEPDGLVETVFPATHGNASV